MRDERARRETGDARGRRETRDALFLAIFAIGFSAFMVWQAKMPAPVYPEPPNAELVDLVGYTSETLEPSEAEKTGLPPDTVIRKRLYHAPNGIWHLVTTVTGGREKSSIHRPELCLPAQGFAMSDPRDLTVAGTDWRVISLARQNAPMVSFAYTTYNQAGFRTSSHLKRIFRDIWDRSLHGRLDRWVLVTVYSAARNDAELSEFMEALDGGLTHCDRK